MARRSNGIVLWQGPSEIDGAPIVAIATGLGRRSANRKTGAMIQIWIIRADCEPHVAMADGRDVSVCGDCPHRGAIGTTGRSCYVMPQTPLAVYRAFVRDRYRTLPLGASAAVLRASGLPVRLGAYGDPCAVPARVWRTLLSGVARWTGYTHAWRHSGPEYREIIMASCDTPTDRTEARMMGWRTFRVGLSFEAPDSAEIHCPADRGMTSCSRCGLCDGARDTDRRRSIYIPVHGAGASAYERFRASLASAVLS